MRRTEEAFVDFLNEHCGTHRAVGGLLDDNAGRHPEFDSMASRFIVATCDVRDTLYKDAQLLGQAFGPKYKYYLRIMEKVVNGTEDYVEKESKRYVLCDLVILGHLFTCLFRLGSILSKRTLAPAKLDEVKIKANILSAFKAVEEKIEEVKEEAEEVIGRAAAEL